MKWSICAALTVAVALAGFASAADKAKKKDVPPALSFKMKSLDGKQVDLSQYLGKVVLMVNVASQCGKTPQYEGLQALYDQHKQDGLAILGFPCNQFGKQEPGSAKQIAEFCEKNYGVTFDMFSKVEVNDQGACELYKFLTSKENNPETGGQIRWNFTKFLLDREGNVVARFEPNDEPDSKKMRSAIMKELKKK